MASTSRFRWVPVPPLGKKTPEHALRLRQRTQIADDDLQLGFLSGRQLHRVPPQLIVPTQKQDRT